MFGDLPPSSITTGTTLSAAILATAMPTVDRAGEGELIDVGMAGQRGAGLRPRAGHHVEDARRQAALERDLAKPQRRHRRFLDGFSTTVQPAASAGAMPRAPIWIG